MFDRLPLCHHRATDICLGAAIATGKVRETEVAKGTWYGDDLIRSLAREQAARQRRRMWGVALVAGLLCVWLSQVDLGQTVAAIGVAGTLVDTAIAWYQADCATRAADALIEERFPCLRREDPVSTAVRRRVETMTSRHRCQELAGLLRWYVRLEDQEIASGSTRCRPVPPIHGLVANRLLVDEIADLLQRGTVDPRATILTERLLRTPLGATNGDPTSASGSNLTTNLLHIRELLIRPSAYMPAELPRAGPTNHSRNLAEPREMAAAMNRRWSRHDRR
jgi:hypothetical protein